MNYFPLVLTTSLSLITLPTLAQVPVPPDAKAVLSSAYTDESE